jgi:ligand-binding SRPBCC domain-containing protein
MITRIYECRIAAPVQKVWDFHSSVAALRVLTPPGRQIEPVGDDLDVREGALHVLKFRQFGLTMEWRARISEVDPPRQFVDTAEKSPFPMWRHRHEFIAEGPAETLIRDTIQYEPPGGPLAWLVDRLFIARDLERLFAFRHDATRRTLEG